MDESALPQGLLPRIYVERFCVGDRGNENMSHTDICRHTLDSIVALDVLGRATRCSS